MDILRHKAIFDPSTVKSPIAIIGAGATGSHVTQNLIKLGISPNLINVYDNDTVESHNLANQIYYSQHVGALKIEALKDVCSMINPEENIQIYNQLVTKDTDLSKYVYVFILVDCMNARKEILEILPKNTFVFETRTDGHSYRIYSITTSIEDKKWWETNWYPNEQAAQSECGAIESIIDTITSCSAAVTRAFVNRVKSNSDRSIEYTFPREFIHFMNSPQFATYTD